MRPVKGALSMAMAAAERKASRKLLVPAANAREAAVVEDVAVFGVGTLAEAVGILSGQLPAEPVAADIDELFAQLNTYDVDFADVRGQEFAKRALVVAASRRPQRADDRQPRAPARRCWPSGCRRSCRR